MRYTLDDLLHYADREEWSIEDLKDDGSFRTALTKVGNDGNETIIVTPDKVALSAEEVYIEVEGRDNLSKQIYGLCDALDVYWYKVAF